MNSKEEKLVLIKAVVKFCYREYEAHKNIGEDDRFVVMASYTAYNGHDVQIEIDLDYNMIVEKIDGDVMDEWEYDSAEQLAEELGIMNYADMEDIGPNARAYFYELECNEQ